MSSKYKQVGVSLSGEDLEIFSEIKEWLYSNNEPEILRIGMRFYHKYYHVIDVLKRKGIDFDNSVEEIIKSLRDVKS